MSRSRTRIPNLQYKTEFQQQLKLLATRLISSTNYLESARQMFVVLLRSCFPYHLLQNPLTSLKSSTELGFSTHRNIFCFIQM